jgi:hypothetical protein
MLTNLLYFIFIFVIIIIFLIRTGQMDTTSVKCLINSISRFILLVSCQTMKPLPIQKDYRDLVGVLKPLKAVLDEVVDSIIPSDEILYKQCEELDMAVDEAREFIENWSPKMSKICSVSNLLLTYFPGSIVNPPPPLKKKKKSAT